MIELDHTEVCNQWTDDLLTGRDSVSFRDIKTASLPSFVKIWFYIGVEAWFAPEYTRRMTDVHFDYQDEAVQVAMEQYDHALKDTAQFARIECSHLIEGALRHEIAYLRHPVDALTSILFQRSEVVDGYHIVQFLNQFQREQYYTDSIQAYLDKQDDSRLDRDLLEQFLINAERESYETQPLDTLQTALNAVTEILGLVGGNGAPDQISLNVWESFYQERQLTASLPKFPEVIDTTRTQERHSLCPNDLILALKEETPVASADMPVVPVEEEPVVSSETPQDLSVEEPVIEPASVVDDVPHQDVSPPAEETSTASFETPQEDEPFEEEPVVSSETPQDLPPVEEPAIESTPVVEEISHQDVPPPAEEEMTASFETPQEDEPSVEESVASFETPPAEEEPVTSFEASQDLPPVFEEPPVEDAVSSFDVPQDLPPAEEPVIESTPVVEETPHQDVSPPVEEETTVSSEPPPPAEEEPVTSFEAPEDLPPVFEEPPVEDAVTSFDVPQDLPPAEEDISISSTFSPPETEFETFDASEVSPEESEAQSQPASETPIEEPEIIPSESAESPQEIHEEKASEEFIEDTSPEIDGSTAIGQTPSVAPSIDIPPVEIDDKLERMFVRKLFNKDSNDYKDVLTQLDVAVSWEEAFSIIEEIWQERGLNLFSKESQEFTRVFYERYYPPA